MPPRSLAHQKSPGVLLAVAALGLTLLTAACGGRHRTNTTQPGQTPATDPGASSSVVPTTPAPTGSGSAIGTWRMLPAAPVPTGHYAVVWTGSEMLVHSPDENVATDPAVGSFDAAYNPTTGTWRKLPSSGLPVAMLEGGYHAVWDGTEMLTWGMQNAAFNPVTNRWRALNAAPIYGTSIVVWTGRQVLMWGGGCCGGANANGAAYTPATDTWQAMPASPLAGRHAAAAWTGRELVIVGGWAPDRAPFADAAAYNPTTRTWRRLPPLPAPRMDATVTWTGTEVVVVGGQPGDMGEAYTDALAYDPATNRWRHLPTMDSGRFGHVAVWTGSQLLVWGGQILVKPPAGQNGPVMRAPAHGLAYDPATNRWTALPVSPLRGRAWTDAVWTGRVMLIWGGTTVADPPATIIDGASYRPA